MPYKINGVTLYLQPTTGRWINREKIGINGYGQAIYPAVTSFELSWDFEYPSGIYEIQELFENIGVSGSITAELPTYRGNAWGFTLYSGCHLDEPQEEQYFNQMHSGVKLFINNIRV